ncbi:MAG: uroporphyrinogen-III synthase [Flavobacteriales bacterium]|nr:uroporphyrinogen-III synthase [Flavobacteriales bacterium]
MKVFVSRSVDKYPQLQQRISEAGGELIACSMIDTEAVPFVEPNDIEWVFFSSVRAVKFYFSSVPPRELKYAAIGPATAKELAKFTEVSFSGKGLDTEVTAQAFAKCVGGARVLFPGSDISLGTVQKHLPEYQVAEVVIYRTGLTPQSVAPCEVYVFTSPSNVRSFFRKNELTSGVVLVPGARTRQEVEKNARVQIIDVPSLEDSDLCRTIFSGLLS